MNYLFSILLISLCFCEAVFGSPIWEGDFPSTGTGKELAVKVYAPDKEARGTIPIAVYLTNLPIERIGTESDEKIIQGLLGQNMAVAVVDYQKHPFLSKRHALVDYSNFYRAFGCYKHPYFEFIKEPPYVIDIEGFGLRYETYKVSQNRSIKRLVFGDAEKPAKHVIDSANIFVLPEGYTVHRNIPLVKNGNITGGDVKRYYMDLIAPVRPVKPVPTILEPCATIVRRDTPATTLNVNSPFFMSFTYFGYAYCSRSYIYEYNEKGEQVWFLHDPDRKAIRKLRANKEKWGLSGKVGVCGISKAAVYSLDLAARRPGQKPREFSEGELQKPPYSYLYGGVSHLEILKDAYEKHGYMDAYETIKVDGGLIPEPERMAHVTMPEQDLGEHKEISDRPDCGLACAVGFDHHRLATVLPYLSKDLPPMYLGVGELDYANKLERGVASHSGFAFRSIKMILDDLGVDDYVYVEQSGLGHQYNYFQYDEILEFKNRHLKN